MTNIIEKPKTNTLIEEYRQQALAYGHEKAIRTFATPMLQHRFVKGSPASKAGGELT